MPPPTDPEVAEWGPHPGFSNKFSEIKRLNDLIIDMTRGENLDLVRLDYHGVKRLRSGKIQHKYDNRLGVVPVWREKEVRKKHQGAEGEGDGPHPPDLCSQHQKAGRAH